MDMDMSSSNRHQWLITPWEVSIMSILPRRDSYKMRRTWEIWDWKRVSSTTRIRPVSPSLKMIKTRNRSDHPVTIPESLPMAQLLPISVAVLHSSKTVIKNETRLSLQLKMDRVFRRWTHRKIWIGTFPMEESMTRIRMSKIHQAPRAREHHRHLPWVFQDQKLVQLVIYLSRSIWICHILFHR